MIKRISKDVVVKRKKPADRKSTYLLPIDIELPQYQMLEDGAMFVVLRTLDELEYFWHENREKFSYAVQGFETTLQHEFLNEYEWVFGPSKASVVKTVFRWKQLGIRCEWYDWANDLSGGHALWFKDRDALNKADNGLDSWTKKDEAEYQEDILKRTPESYRGWWKLGNLPPNLCQTDWLNLYGSGEIIDPNLSQEVVENLLQEHLFNEGQFLNDEINFEDAESVEKIIAYWRGEQKKGMGYYGDEEF